MKRISLVVALSFLCFLLSHSQVRVAILGGGHQSKILEDNSLPGWDSVKQNYSGRNGAHFGFMADIRLSQNSNFYFQPSVQFFNKGRKYKSPSTDSTVIYKIRTVHDDSTVTITDSIVDTKYFQEKKQYINYIEIPLNIVYKLKLGKKASFIIGGGPYFSLFYNGFYKTEDMVVDVSVKTVEDNSDLPVGKGKGKFSTLNLGVNGLAGFEYGRFFLTANYSRGLKDFHEPDYSVSNYKHEVKGATLGIFLGKQAPSVPKDKDGDGTPDKTDKCPDIAGPAKFLGCPDIDNDGIQDTDDKCPGEAGPVENNGCPYPDKDNDGVLDKDDQCPEIAGPKDNAGCPYADTDKDGIVDKEDKCPEQAGLGRYQGCPVPDTDGDGINDEEDKCPTVKGLTEKNGCPEEIKKEIVEKVEYAAKRIQFKVNSAELQSGSFKVLDEVANILKDNPDIKVVIEGHTSSEGRYEVNMKLSEKRANTVKAYLQSKGIDSARLTAIGFGPDRPLNSGKTATERAENRRVELKLSNQ